MTNLCVVKFHNIHLVSVFISLLAVFLGDSSFNPSFGFCFFFTRYDYSGYGQSTGKVSVS